MKRLCILGLVALLALVPAVVAAGTVNINAADAETLAESLDGIGPVKAQAIVEHREANGDFASVEELLEVRGIGDGTLDSLRDSVSTGDSE